uniref:Centrosomal protein 192 n=1 Tax=Myripristis murdjan TaxID=586833 RepID=A0A667ZNW0_9TELE
MEASFLNLEDEAFPSFLCKSLDSTTGRATLGNVTLGSGPGLPVAASTEAKIRAGADNRWDHVGGLEEFSSDIAKKPVELMNCTHFPQYCVLSSNYIIIRLELYFNKLVPPAMQRGRVEGQEIPAAVSLFSPYAFVVNTQSVLVMTCLTYSAPASAIYSWLAKVYLKNIFFHHSSFNVTVLFVLLGANINPSVVYQNEEGQWVTDLAYYSSFEKEVDGNTPEQFGNAIDKIVKDQEEFEKEHQFMQEEQIEAATVSPLLADSSWKLPSSSHILMRASQVSSEFEQGNQSYLRLSLGAFFGQRSEALGCLGSGDADGVKRPSFGYIITSPEKREPFPLIRPSDFSSRNNSVHNETFELSETDKTLNPGMRLHHFGCYRRILSYDRSVPVALPDHTQGSDSILCTANQSSISPLNSSSPLMLSISTIASAIADASISSDPSQLAAMMLELSKRSKARSRPGHAMPASSTAEKTAPVEHVKVFKGCSEPPVLGVEETQCNFRPSTSPLIHSSPSQTSFPKIYPYLSFIIIRTENKLSTGSSTSTELAPGSFWWKRGNRKLHFLASVILFPFISSSGQVVVPEELQFPHACCVGIASQTTLSLFNPSERWQQVLISVSSLAIDGEKVDSLPYQWLIVKNKTVIGPKTTEEQKVLFIPPRAGVYRCVLNVSSWPASAESEVAARAEVFAKRVVLVAIAENPALEVEVGKTDCLDFGDLTAGSAKSLPLKLLNRTRATLPIRLVISANVTAWRCFTFSKHPIAMTSEASLQVGHMTQVSSPSVMNHVMHASYGENPESFMVWVLFRAPHKYSSSSELGPADEYSARVDIEVDCPGPSHVIRSIPLRARSGIARVHAPKDLQTVSLSAPLGKSSQQTLPLKNAGNIDVQLKLKVILTFAFLIRSGIWVRPLCLFFLCRSLLTILVLPSGPQYEVTLKGVVSPEDGGKPATASAAKLGPGMVNNIPPILSNKQFVAWGGVTLGRAVQQKLVLRNNSPNTTQQLRLLIRGQDQDCFQLQSMFSVEERLTRHGELSIRPREDVAVHLLFAPTRVACMLAKLEIKQSGVRPSQPGVKFTIPLSGYGGTSNIILEDQRKQADGYVATLTSIAVGRVSKVCLCVRNTGSRAAFIKAVAFSDMQTRKIMEPSIVSLAPSQFILKERTQEMTLYLRGMLLFLQSSSCVFVCWSLRLLQSKPEAGRKVLSENSLLKNIDFNEKFLGEEQVTETYDLPQRPNEAHIFYGNMSKVVVSLLGSTNNSDSGESDHAELLQPSAHHASETDSGFTNGNVSLDVLPVKGPQGPALRVSEPSLKVVILNQLYWMNGAATTKQVQIRNDTSRELSFELSWPAHCLTITPQHGVIEPQCHLQILISPNPSLASKYALLPWSGQIYVQCDGQHKFIKVQIRQDLALDVSAAPADRSLAALAPQAATPLLPVVRPHTKPSQPPLTPQTPQALVEISNKTIIFPTTTSGETSEAQLEVENGEEEVRWYLSSFAPPYVKGVDNTGDVYRATYTAFRCSRVSGTLGVPITFLPRDRGDYAQFWDLECHPVSEPQQKTRIRFQLCGMGVKCGPVEAPQEGDCSLVKTEATVKPRKRAEVAAVKTGQEEAVRKGVYSPQDLYTFPATRVGESSTLKVSVRNNSADMHELKFVNPRDPFHIKHSKYSLRSQHYLKLPVQFKPTTAGTHAGLLLIQSETSGSLVIQLTGEALP